MITVLLLPYYQFYIIDDAYISFRHAYNFAHGYGLVFNQGERVEGITNLLWTLIISFFLKTGFDRCLCIEQIILYASLVLSVGTIIVAIDIAKRLGVRPYFIGLSLILFVLPVPFFNSSAHYWLSTTNGLEGALFAFLVLTSTKATVINNHHLLGCVLGWLCFMTRPEGLLVYPVCRLVGGNYSDPANNKWLPGVLYVIMVISIIVLRLIYFDSWCPNTLLAKKPEHLSELILNVRNGYAYTEDFFTDCHIMGASLIITLYGMICFILDRNDFRHVGGICVSTSILIGVQITTVMVNGGDWMPNYRLITPWSPLLLICFALVSEHLITQRNFMAILVIVMIIEVGIADWDGGINYKKAQWKLAVVPKSETEFTRISSLARDGSASNTVPCILRRRYQGVTELLSNVVKPTDVIAPEAIGYIGYGLIQTKIHDFLGLTERYIARNGSHYHPTFGKSNLDYSMTKVRPTILVFHDRGNIDAFPKNAKVILQTQYTEAFLSQYQMTLFFRNDSGLSIDGSGRIYRH